MNEQVAIRRAVVEDIDAVISLCVAHALYEQSPLGVAPDRQRLRHALFGDSPALLLWVAEAAGSLLGYASGSMGCNTWAARLQFNLDCLYLTAEARGKGLGAALMRAVSDHATQQGCVLVEWVTPSWNEQAIGFYKAIGANGQARERFRLALDTEPV